MTKCLLFDCDGTLVDSENLGNIGMVIKFRDFGIELDPEDLLKRFRGWELAQTLEALEAEYQLSLPDNFVSSLRAIVTELFEANLRPIADVKYALDELPGPKAVVSNGPSHKINHTLRICGLTDYFGSNIYSSYDVGIWKPDPGLYQHAAMDMGYSVKDCVVIDDGIVGIEAGYRAGMKTLFYNRFKEPCEFPSVISFDSMKELPNLIHN